MNRYVLSGLILTASVAVASAQTIGPDAYGYQLTRTGNASAAASGYTTIVGGAGTTQLTTTGTSQDDVTFTVAAGFNFPFYGTLNSQVFVSTNGFIAMGGNTGSATSGSYNNPSLANSTILVTGGTGAPTIERAVIAPYWDDLYFAGTQPGALFSANRTVNGVNELVLEYSGVQFFGAQTTPQTFQTVLRENGTMSFYYPDVTSAASGTNGAEATIGIHDLNGGGAANMYLQYSFNTPAALSNFDRIDFVIVPEPGLMSLAGFLTVGGLAAVRRRLRNRAPRTEPVTGV